MVKIFWASPFGVAPCPDAVALLNPTNKRGTKAAYTELRKFLVRDGYIASRYK